MRGGRRLVGGIVVLAIGVVLLPGCSGVRGAAARTAVRNPEPSREVTTTTGCIVDFAAAGTTAVWSERDRIMRWDTATASVPTTLVAAADARGVAIHATSVYWVGAPVDIDAPRTVHRIDISGTGERVLATTGDRTEEIAADADGGVYWIARAANRASTNELWAIDPRGGEPHRIGPVDGVARTLAIAAGHAYWDTYDPDADDSVIRRMALAGGDTETVVGVSGLIAALAVDDRGLVYISGNGTLSTAAVDGTEAHVLARFTSTRSAIGLEADRVYVVVDNALLAVSRWGGAVDARIDLGHNRVEHLVVTEESVFLAAARFFPHEGCLGSRIRRIARPA